MRGGSRGGRGGFGDRGGFGGDRGGRGGFGGGRGGGRGKFNFIQCLLKVLFTDLQSQVVLEAVVVEVPPAAALAVAVLLVEEAEVVPRVVPAARSSL